MKKEDKATPISNKTRSVYKYELQATNQILQDTLDIYPSSLHSTARTNRYKNTLLQSSDQQLYPQNQLNLQNFPLFKQKQTEKHKKQKIFEDNDDTKFIKKSFQDGYLSKLLYLKQSTPRKKSQKIKKQDDLYQQIHLNSQIYQFSPDILIQSKKQYSCLIDKQIEYSNKKDSQTENRKQMRKQRRGLANISLKVKNIVAKRGKMTFKEVSDEVLRESQQDLPIQHQQCQKQTKNIRRRVYDALNVLVSVGILGKQQRCVVHTQFTNIPGKKLSSHWDIITQKNRILEQSQLNFNHKYQNLINLKKQYQYMMYLRQRNRKNKINDETKEQYFHKQIMNKTVYKQFRFPLVVILPPKLPLNNMTIKIEYEERSNQIVKKYEIKGNELILTDVDLLKHLKLSQNLKIQQINSIKDQIQDLQNFKYQTPQNQRILSRRQPFQNIQDIYLQD